MNDLAKLLAGLAGLADAATSPRLVGVGWATVDIERTARDLAAADLDAVADDELLGARSWRTTSGPISLVLLEPITEGRLAAALARRGEGIVALYLRSNEPIGGVLGRTALEVPGRLMPQTHPWGPFVILVEAGPQ